MNYSTSFSMSTHDRNSISGTGLYKAQKLHELLIDHDCKASKYIEFVLPALLVAC